MLPLLDGDILTYEVGFGVMTGWEGDSPPPFEMARELLENKIANICALAGGDEPPKLFLTGKDNFREKIATIKPYKGTRQQPKPYHYYNLRAYMEGVLGATVVDGMEADDAICIYQCSRAERGSTIICSRDKDLLQCPGWHYVWECGNQPSLGPLWVEGYGHIEHDAKGKLRGYGEKFFLSQMITGDRTDNIAGIPRKGPVEALKMLGDTTTYLEGLERVVEGYKEVYGDLWRDACIENGRLLYLLRKEGDMWELNEGT